MPLAMIPSQGKGKGTQVVQLSCDGAGGSTVCMSVASDLGRSCGDDHCGIVTQRYQFRSWLASIVMALIYYTTLQSSREVEATSTRNVNIGYTGGARAAPLYDS